MKFAKRVFLIAGVYGLIVLLALYFLEEKTGRDFPPPITHPEHYYGFIGVGSGVANSFSDCFAEPDTISPNDDSSDPGEGKLWDRSDGSLFTA